ncbi:HNH endonuclease [Natronobacterium lacisalsi]|uniref:HNH endonuclease n=1 Tax=Natronobacterium lacisalsi TaxID=229731 RepID=UPI0004960C48|nr:hypothetical protein [Halobiforma lacisalsi]
MPSPDPEPRGDRAAVFDRDDRTCRRCGASDDADGLCLYPVGDVPLEGTVHESALVTVCNSCFAGLERTPTPDSLRLEADDLFDLVRETTQRQGVTVSAVASFASLATSLPAELDAESTDSDPAAEYVQARREVLLAMDSVPSRLERLSAVETGHLEADVASDRADNEPPLAEPLEGLTDAATRLQSELRDLIALAEAVAVGLDRCQGCLEPFDVPDSDTEEPRQCPTCGLEPCDAGRWRGADGAVVFDRLYDEINAELQNASDTTEELTEGAAAVAERLAVESDPGN